MPARTAVLLGATGLVGRHVLARLAHDARWGRVVTLGRRPLPTASGTHEDHVVDFDRLAEQAALFACDDLVCALGTTMKQAGSEAAFQRVDLEIPFEAAQLAHRQGATQMLLVSALGADAGSRIFYNRTKGEAEDAVRSVGFEAVQILRPSL
ncbi:MAG: NAD(P)H-binding protein, partial [Bacteroidota bacterium]